MKQIALTCSIVILLTFGNLAKAQILKLEFADGSSENYDQNNIVSLVYENDVMEMRFSDMTSSSWNLSIISNMLFMDQSIGVEEPESDKSSFSIFPNPADERTTVKYVLHESSETIISIYDITGSLLYQKNLGTLSAGKHEFPCDLQAFKKQIPTGSACLVQIKSRSQSYSGKLIVK